MTSIHPLHLDTSNNGDLRLTDGLTRYEGRVEMYWNSRWRTLCNNGWDELDAKVVCRQLNYLSTSVQVNGTCKHKQISMHILSAFQLRLYMLA